MFSNFSQSGAGKNKLATVGSWYINKVGIYKINFMWYGVFGLVTTCVVGYIASLFFPAPDREKFENIEK